MDYREWGPIYTRILEDFGFSRKEDEKAGRILSDLIEERPPIEILEKLIKGRIVNVFGAGPSLELIETIPKGTNIVADGVASFFLKKMVIPEIIVTDLDGKVDDIIKANKNGSLVVVHGHGDNMEELEKYVPLLKNIIPTTQSEPFGNVYNFGGFTDGDRAVLMADHFGAREIRLFAMDFDSEIGRYSFSRDTDFKRKKLVWAKRILVQRNLLE